MLMRLYEVCNRRTNEVSRGYARTFFEFCRQRNWNYQDCDVTWQAAVKPSNQA